MITKKLSAWIMILMLLFSLCGCQKDIPSIASSCLTPTTTSVSSEKQVAFRGTKAGLPEGMYLCPTVEPYTNEDRILCLASEITETEAEDGTVVTGETYSLVSLWTDGRARDAAPLNLPETAAVIGGEITGDGFALLTMSDGIVSVFTRDASGDRTSGDLAPL